MQDPVHPSRVDPAALAVIITQDTMAYHFFIALWQAGTAVLLVFALCVCTVGPQSFSSSREREGQAHSTATAGPCTPDQQGHRIL